MLIAGPSACEVYSGIQTLLHEELLSVDDVDLLVFDYTGTHWTCSCCYLEFVDSFDSSHCRAHPTPCSNIVCPKCRIYCECKYKSRQCVWMKCWDCGSGDAEVHCFSKQGIMSEEAGSHCVVCREVCRTCRRTMCKSELAGRCVVCDLPVCIVCAVQCHSCNGVLCGEFAFLCRDYHIARCDSEEEEEGDDDEKKTKRAKTV